MDLDGTAAIGTFNVLSEFAARIVDAEPVGPDGERSVIINTASVARYDGQIGPPAYAASKDGIVPMVARQEDQARLGGGA